MKIQHSPKKQHGFTLIEVLLVVLLIGVVSGIVLLAASPNDASRVVATEAERLADALSLASEEAVNNNQQIGLFFDEKNYYFLVLDEQSQKWEASDDAAFSSYELPPVVSLHLIKEDNQKSIVLEDTHDKEQKEQTLSPQLLFLSNGESSSVILELVSDDNSQQRIVVDDLGTITLNPEANANEKSQ